MNDIYQQSSNGNITEVGTCAHKWYHPKDVFKVAFLLTFFLGAASILLITAKTCHFVDIIEGSIHCQTAFSFPPRELHFKYFAWDVISFFWDLRKGKMRTANETAYQNKVKPQNTCVFFVFMKLCFQSTKKESWKYAFGQENRSASTD